MPINELLESEPMAYDGYRSPRPPSRARIVRDEICGGTDSDGPEEF